VFIFSIILDGLFFLKRVALLNEDRGVVVAVVVASVFDICDNTFGINSRHCVIKVAATIPIVKNMCTTSGYFSKS
jgi:hypothetical protein